MPAKLHFISGMPRSGTTLLAGILRQNPAFHASMSGPVAPMIQALLGTFAPQNEGAIFVDEATRQRLLRAVVDAYHAPHADKAVVFDTNRGWCARLPVIRALYPESRVIVCVRDVAWIIDSFERLFQKSPFETSRMLSPKQRATVDSRAEALASRDRLVGFAWSAVREAYFGPNAEALLSSNTTGWSRTPVRASPGSTISSGSRDSSTTSTTSSTTSPSSTASSRRRACTRSRARSPGARGRPSCRPISSPGCTR